jgi:signal transduction histidine kinase
MHLAKNHKDLTAEEALAACYAELSYDHQTRRIENAHVLHRDIAGSIVAGLAMAELIKCQLQSPTSLPKVKLDQMLDSLCEQLRNGLEHVRDLTEKQVPAALKAFGLNAALEQIVSEQEQELGAPIRLQTDAEQQKMPLETVLSISEIARDLIQSVGIQQGGLQLDIETKSYPSRLDFCISYLQQHRHPVPPAVDQQLQAKCRLMGAELKFETRLATRRQHIRLVVHHS